MENPLPFIVAGLVVGATYGLAGMGLVLSYRLSKVVNFAHGGVALFCAYSFWQMEVAWGWPRLVALPMAALVVPAALGLAAERLVLGRVSGTSLFARTSASVGLLLVVLGVSLGKWGEAQVSVPSVFPDGTFRLPGVTVSYSQLGVVLVASALGAALFALLRFTRLGVELRAVVDRPELAELRGIDIRRVTRIAWMINFVLAAVSGLLLAPALGSQALALVAIVVASLVVAAVGAMASLPITLGAGIALGLTDALLLGFLPQGEVSTYARGFLPFLMLSFALVVQARRAGKVPQASGRRTALLLDLGDLPAGLVEPGPLAALGVSAVLLAFGAVAGELWVLSLSTGVAYAVILLSFKSFTATTGLVSLAQGAFAGIAAFTAAELLVDHGAPWPLALVAATGVSAITGVAMALPTVRLRGVFLALATIAFTQLADSTVFASKAFTGGTFGRPFGRPWGFSSDLGYLALLLAFFFVLARGTDALRRSVTGRALQADLAASAGARSIGIRPELGRLVAFAVAASIAGVGGVLLSGVTEHVPLGLAGLGSTWGLISTLLWLTVLAIGGIGSIWGAFGAGLVLGVTPEVLEEFPALRNSYTALFGLASIVALRRPGGIVVRLRGLRRGLRRAIDAERSAADSHDRAPLPALAASPARLSRILAPDTKLAPLKSVRR